MKIKTLSVDSLLMLCYTANIEFTAKSFVERKRGCFMKGSDKDDRVYGRGKQSVCDPSLSAEI